MFYFKSQTAPLATKPCSPSPCGPNSICREVNDQAVCTCAPGYLGSPPMCRPECIGSSDCPRNQACTNQRCINPCLGTCGLQAKCEVINHNPICSCPERYSGNPFTRCFLQRKRNNSKILIFKVRNISNVLYFLAETPALPQNPCVPSPCGPYSSCQIVNNAPSCSCQPQYIGSPPNCRPECISNSECTNNQACLNEKCRDPCPGSCGANAECRVVSHTPNCMCISPFSGDPFVQCLLLPSKFHKLKSFENYWINTKIYTKMLFDKEI